MSRCGDEIWEDVRGFDTRALLIFLFAKVDKQDPLFSTVRTSHKFAVFDLYTLGKAFYESQDLIPASIILWYYEVF